MKEYGQVPTILIVEDIEWLRSRMKKLVECQGYQVAEAKNDKEAFKSAELLPIDLILTEEQVPTFEALMARLHQHPTLRSVPVVIVNPDAEEGARLGHAYLLADYADISSFLAVLHH